MNGERNSEVFSWLEEEMTEEAEELFHLLYTKEFDGTALRKVLDTGRFSSKDVNRAAIDYVQTCMDLRHGDYGGAVRRYGETVPGFEDSHVVEALEILLDFGLDPNKRYIEKNQDGNVRDCWNIMQELWTTGNGYQGADALALLLSHGGDPSLMLDRITVTDDVTDSVEFEIDERGNINDFAFDALIHIWLVLIGFGGKSVNGSCPLDPVHGFDLSLLRNHRDYYYGKIFTEESEDGWQYCIFDRHTNREVARF